MLPIDSTIGLAPQLPYLKGLYDQGRVAIVRGVGTNPPDLSHFSSMASVMAGRFGGGAPTSGWLGRWLDGQPASANLAVVTTDTSVPLHLVGATRKAAGVSVKGAMFGTAATDADRRMYTVMRSMSRSSAGRGALHDAFAASVRAQLDVAAEVAPVFATPIPDGGELVGKMTAAARLINANIGVRVVDVGRGDFDTHHNQPYRLNVLLTELDAALAAFYATLSPELASKVVITTMSEFGRTLEANGSSGTDHGSAASHFVIGHRVKGGLHGTMPSFTSLDRTGRLISSVDFRSIYGTVLDGWLGGGGADVLGGTSWERLDLFLPETITPTTTTTTTEPATTTTTVPSVTTTSPAIPTTTNTIPSTTFTLPPGTTPPVSYGNGFVPIAPTRIVDTRTGVGGRSTPLAATANWSLAVAGRSGVPTDARAVVLNVSSVSATAATFLTVWPSGTTRPRTTSLIPAPGRTVQNLVVTEVGSDGGVQFSVGGGTTHLLVDVVGYMAPLAGAQLAPVTPARIVDTRNGTGAPTGKLAAARELQVQVTGRGGVPSDATSVVVNVTTAQPTAATDLTVWPTGTARPAGATTSTTTGRMVTTLAVVRVGTGGKVSLRHGSGSTHVVLDVVGWFGGGAPLRYRPAAPTRLLDTRSSTGGAFRRVSTTQPVELQVTNLGGVPAGITAALLTVVAVKPSVATSLTVYPSGSTKPSLTNVSANASEIVANTVLARLGADGAVTIANGAGLTDVVVDLVGWFQA